MKGRDAVVQGGRVQITSGIYAGEFAIVESVVGGVIPAAIVRTEAGRTRRARTVDLIPSPISAAPKAAPPGPPDAAEPPAPEPSSPD